ncbi:uncharacterized protein METZ01_LOCUS28163 [marine metagenome]|uniref:Uncharacterized protein n=1 Tax=marine metagenome TaxID=408172 RepID=A0A381QA84_9ZZZZ
MLVPNQLFDATNGILFRMHRAE